MPNLCRRKKTDLAEAKKKPQSSKAAPTKTGKSNKQEAGKARVESAVKASDDLFNFMRSLSTEKDSAPTEIVPVSTQTTNAPSRVLDLLDRPTQGSAINFTNFVTDGSLLTNNYTPINSNNTTLNKTVPVLPNTATTTYNSSEKIDTHHVFKPFPLQPVHMEWNNNEPSQPSRDNPESTLSFIHSIPGCSPVSQETMKKVTTPPTNIESPYPNLHSLQPMMQSRRTLFDTSENSAFTTIGKAINASMEADSSYTEDLSCETESIGPESIEENTHQASKKTQEQCAGCSSLKGRLSDLEEENMQLRQRIKNGPPGKLCS